MNCDQVFDILTRGPFPTGTACDAGVEAHLNVCGQCRRLAEALRPAVELFQEAIGGEESRDLPGYWCAVATDRKQPALSAELHEARSAAAQAPAAARAGAGFSALTVWRMAAMLALGVTLGLLVNSRMSMDGFSTVPPVTASGGAAAADDGESPKAHLTVAERSVLAALPAACTRNVPGRAPRYTERGDQLLATADLSNLDCCSKCHHADSDRVPSGTAKEVSKQCQVCHR